MKMISKLVAAGLIVSAGFVGQALADTASVHNPAGQSQNVNYNGGQAAFTVPNTNAMVTPSSLGTGKGSVIAYVAPDGSQLNSVVIEGPQGGQLASTGVIPKNSNGTFTAIVNVNNVNITLLFNSNGGLMSASIPEGTQARGMTRRVLMAAGVKP